MKLLSYEFEGAARLGALADDGVIDIGRRLGVNSLRKLLEAGKLAEATEFEGAQPDHALGITSLHGRGKSAGTTQRNTALECCVARAASADRHRHGA